MKRILCAMVALVVLIGLLPFAAVEARAESAMTTSDSAIEVIKNFEGFRSMAYLDNGGYSIGYGTRCEKDSYPNGITKEKADSLLRNSLSQMEADLNRMVDKYSLKLSQHQFDALMVFTYNLGTGWTLSSSDFRKAVINGLSGNDFIFYITRWCNESEKVSTGLAKRRLAEADMYLNGYYSTKAPSNYSYVLFDVNGNGSTDVKIQGYDACTPVAVRATAYSTGYRFMGWYTKKTGGTRVTMLDASTKEMTLYAHWQKVENGSQSESVVESAVSYERIASSGLSAYAKPNGTVTKKIEKGTVLRITADYIDGNNIVWGKLSDGSWVKLAQTTVKTKADAAPSRPSNSTSSSGNGSNPNASSGNSSNGNTVTNAITVSITGNSVNFRAAAGTDQKILGSYPRGYSITVTEVKEIGGVKWGKFKDGWMCLTYTNYDLLTATGETDKKDDVPSDTTSGTAIATGTVINCGSLRYRSAVGTNSDILGTIPEGTKVSILEWNADKSWGRISLGWISLAYVKLDGESEKPDTSAPSDSQQGGSAVTGYVTVGALNVREGAGLSYKAVAMIPLDRKITITEQTTVGGVKWGKTDLGWVCMNYIKVVGGSASGTNGSTSGANGSTGTSGSESGSNTNGSTDTQSITGTVTASVLCVRSGAGSNYAVKSALSLGATVKVTAQKLVNGLVWGKIESGWICMSYVKITSGSNSTAFDATIMVESLCVRSAPGTSNAVVDGYVKGQTVRIYETKTVGGTSWGRTEKGWIAMQYVK